MGSTAPDDPPTTRTDGYEIRRLASQVDFEASVALQKAVWGANFTDVVPPATLRVALEIGGVVAGAFHADTLVGLVFGLTGTREGEAVHWSDILAVRPEHRGRGLAVRLKRFQRAALLPLGVRTVLWTFDPLEGINAYLNLTRLGATAAEYRRDMYGPGASPLHHGIGTDRLVVRWSIDEERVRRRLEGEERGPRAGEVDALPLCNPTRAGAAGPVSAEPDLSLDAPRVRIAVPAMIQTLKARYPALAADWRRKTRAAFEAYFAKGYTAVEAVPEGERCGYVLEREERPALI